MREIAAVQRANAEAGLRFERIGLGVAPYITVTQWQLPSQQLELTYDTSRSQLRGLLDQAGLPARQEPADHDHSDWRPPATAHPFVRYANVLNELWADGEAFATYIHQLGFPWPASTLTEVTAGKAGEAQLSIAFEGRPWTACVIIRSGNPAALIGIGYSIVEHIDQLLHRPTIEQQQQMQTGSVQLIHGRATP
ncbi:hypothetical protein ABZW11_12880 [Nonomuraea sp. NPDC004580]|uniref:hypothetical protein n=1 Tax=Nonomuraea sp. NPDC004580 TaxID=3154552 RepID=UPI0033B2A554